MQVWNMLHVARWKYRTQKSAICSPSHNFVGYIFPTKACINNQKKLVKQLQNLHMSSQYSELQPTSSWDQLASLGHLIKFHWALCLGFIIFATWSIAFNRGHHVHLAWWPSRWVSAHILILQFLIIYLIYRVGQKITFSIYHTNATLQGKMKWISPKCSQSLRE